MQGGCVDTQRKNESLLFVTGVNEDLGFNQAQGLAFCEVSRMLLRKVRAARVAVGGQCEA